MSSSFKIVLGVLGGAVLVFVLLTVFAGSGPFGLGPMMGPGGMMEQGGMMDSGWGVFGIVLMLVPLLLLGGLIAVIVWAVIQLASGGMPPVVRAFTNSRPRRSSGNASLVAR